MNGFDIDLTDPAQAGVFFVTGGDLDVLEHAGREHALLVRRIDLAACAGKAGLLQRFAAALAFPASFGHNWDALADSLGDLEWLPAPGYVLLLDHAVDLRDADEADFDTLLDILEQTAATWDARDTPFFAFLALPENAFDA